MTGPFVGDGGWQNCKGHWLGGRGEEGCFVPTYTPVRNEQCGPRQGRYHRKQEQEPLSLYCLPTGSCNIQTHTFERHGVCCRP